MSPQTSLPAASASSSRQNVRAGQSQWQKSLASTPKLPTALNAAVVQTIVTAVVQVVHDFKATGFRRPIRPTLVPRILPSGSQDEAPRQVYLARRCQRPNGFNKTWAEPSKPGGSSNPIQFERCRSQAPPTRPEMLDGLNPDFAEFQNGASLCSTSKLHQPGICTAGSRYEKHPTGPGSAGSKRNRQCSPVSSRAFQFDDRCHGRWNVTAGWMKRKRLARNDQISTVPAY